MRYAPWHLCSRLLLLLQVVLHQRGQACQTGTLHLCFSGQGKNRQSQALQHAQESRYTGKGASGAALCASLPHRWLYAFKVSAVWLRQHQAEFRKRSDTCCKVLITMSLARRGVLQLLLHHVMSLLLLLLRGESRLHLMLLQATLRGPLRVLLWLLRQLRLMRLLGRQRRRRWGSLLRGRSLRRGTTICYDVPVRISQQLSPGFGVHSSKQIALHTGARLRTSSARGRRPAKTSSLHNASRKNWQKSQAAPPQQ